MEGNVVNESEDDNWKRKSSTGKDDSHVSQNIPVPNSSAKDVEDKPSPLHVHIQKFQEQTVPQTSTHTTPAPAATNATAATASLPGAAASSADGNIKPQSQATPAIASSPPLHTSSIKDNLQSSTNAEAKSIDNKTAASLPSEQDKKLNRLGSDAILPRGSAHSPTIAASPNAPLEQDRLRLARRSGSIKLNNGAGNGGVVLTVDEEGQTKLVLNHDKELDLIMQENIKSGAQVSLQSTRRTLGKSHRTVTDENKKADMMRQNSLSNHGKIQALLGGSKDQGTQSAANATNVTSSAAPVASTTAPAPQTSTALAVSNAATQQQQPSLPQETLPKPPPLLQENRENLNLPYEMTRSRLNIGQFDRKDSMVDGKKKDPLLGRASDLEFEEDYIEDEIFDSRFSLLKCCHSNAVRATEFARWMRNHWKDIARLLLFTLFLSLTIYYAGECDYIAPECIAGQVFIWEWFLAASIWVIAWPVSELILNATILMASRSLSRVARYSQQSKDASFSVSILYYMPSMYWHLGMLLSFAIATLSFFSILYPNDALNTNPGNNSTTNSSTLSPTSSPTITPEHVVQNQPELIWASLYPQLLNVLTLICVYLAGRAFSKYLTLMISQEFNTRTYGEKVDYVIKTELMLFKLLGGIPFETDRFMYEMIENPNFVQNDPRVYTAISRSIRHRPFRLLLSQGGTGDDAINENKSQHSSDTVEYDVEVSMNSLRIAELIGRICFRCIWAHSQVAQINASALKNNAFEQQLEQQQQQEHQQSELTSTFVQPNQHGFVLTIDNGHPTPNILPSGSRNQKHPSEGEAGLVAPQSSRSMPKFQSSLSLAMMSKKRPERDARKRQRITKDDLQFILAAPNPPIFESLQPKAKNINPEVKKRQENLLNFKVDDVWNFLDTDRLGYCEKKHVGAAVAKFYEERKNLADTLIDARNVVRTLENFISAVINFFVILCALAIWGLNVMEMWVSISSIILGFSFVFSGTAANAFSALVFVFGTHPYDVGDLVRVGTDWYRVLKIHILNTTMQRWDGSLVKFNNTELSRTPIYNLRTSGLYSYYFTVWVDVDFLTKPVLDVIRKDMKKFVDEDKDNYSGEVSVNTNEFKNPFKVAVNFWIESTFNESARSRIFPVGCKIVIRICQLLTSLGARYTGVSLGTFQLNSQLKVSNADGAKTYIDSIMKTKAKNDEGEKRSESTRRLIPSRE